MLLCAQYILPVSSEPIIDGAVLVRDGVIRAIGPGIGPSRPDSGKPPHQVFQGVRRAHGYGALPVPV